jgi:TonB family protein
METVVQTPVEPELNLLTQWYDPADEDRRRRAAIATVLVHAVALTILFLLPESFFEEKQPQPVPVRHITPIFEPLTRLTQKAPNTVKTPKEFSVQQPQARPHPPAPVPQPAGPKPAPVRQAVIPPAPPPKPTQQLPEPPKVDATVRGPKIEEPQLGTVPPPPKIQAQESPKLPLENLNQGPPPVVPPDKRVVPIPDASPSAALRNLGGGAPHLPTPVQGPDNDPSALQLPQLLTDNQGVDFTPYLRVILQTVKRNWQSVMPEAVRLGRRGKVSIVFSIGRDGQVIKLVIADPSGVDSFDKAAIAGISMSNPFPPLPGAFRADHIAVQFNFAYNTPRK